MAQRWKIVATLAALAVATWAALAPGPAWAWDPVAPAPPADFTAFNRRFSSDLYPYPRHGAAPLGLLGFEIYAAATHDKRCDEEPFFRTVIDGNLPSSTLSTGRAGERTGPPAGVARA